MAKRKITLSLEQFRATCEALPDAVALSDLKGRIVCANSQLARMFGYAEDELIGKEIDVLLPEGMRNAHRGHRAAYYEALPVRPMGKGLFLLGRRRDGSEFPVDISLSPLNIGSNTFVVSVVRDFIEHKRLQDVMLESEEKLRLLIESTDDVIMMHDLEGRYIYANPSSRYGVRPEDILWKKPADLFPPEEAQRMMDRIRTVASSGQSLTVESSVTWKGRELWFHALYVPVRGIGGSIVAVGIFGRNITDARMAEEALRKSERLARTIMESAEDLIFLQDSNGRYQYWPSSGRYGLNERDVVGKTPEEVFGPFVGALLRERVSKVVSTRTTLAVEERALWGGKEIWLQTRLSPVPDEDGNVVGIVGVARDIGDLMTAKDALHSAEEKLALETMRSRIAADLHDEIGSTLSSVSMFNAMLGHAVYGRDDHALELSARIQESIERAQEALHEIVWTINPGNDSLEDIVYRIQEYATELLEAKGIRVRVDISERLPAIDFGLEKRRQMFLIFKEAVNNVMRHSSCREVTMTTSVEGSSLHISLKDNGDGFDPLRQARGNGLQNMQSRAERIGASLAVDSREGDGTTVVLTLPIA